MNPGHRHNPFSSHLVEPARGGYIFNDKSTFPNLDAVMQHLKAYGYRGHLIGPHGAGKSTLLTDIQTTLLSVGKTVSRWQCNDRHRRLPSGWLHDVRTSNVILIDGAERLYPGLLTLVRIFTRRHGCGVIITTHAPVSLGASIAVRPNPAALAAKIAALTNGEAPATGTASSALIRQLSERLQQQNGNAREVLFDLYIEHETQLSHLHPPAGSDQLTFR